MAEEVKQTDSLIKDKRVREEGNGLIAIIVGILLLIISLIIVFGVDLFDLTIASLNLVCEVEFTGKSSK